MILTVSAVVLYSALMIVIRLKITESGYAFEEGKSYERALREEQIKLKADLSTLLSVRELKTKFQSSGLVEPEPRQIVVIP